MSISKYDKILYLDTDIIVKGDVNIVFDCLEDDVLYALEEGNLLDDANNRFDFYGGLTLFGNEAYNYEDKTAFSSGVLLFNNCETIKTLFDNIKKHIVSDPHDFCCYDQPYIVYNSFKYNLYNNKVLKKFIIDNNYDVTSDKIIHHFSGGPGYFERKIDLMTIFLNKLLT